MEISNATFRGQKCFAVQMKDYTANEKLRFPMLLAWGGEMLMCSKCCHCAPPFLDMGLSVPGLGFRVQGSGFRVQDSGFRVQGSGFRVQGSGFRVQGSGFRVSVCRVKGGGKADLRHARSLVTSSSYVLLASLELSDTQVYEH